MDLNLSRPPLATPAVVVFQVEARDTVVAIMNSQPLTGGGGTITYIDPLISTTDRSIYR